MTLERYQQHRRAWEVGLWVAFFLVNFLAQVGVVWVEFGRRQLEFQRWEAVVWEGSSILVQLVVLLPLILWFDRRFPLARPDLARNARAHLMFTVPFSILHVLGMVGLREIAYGVAGGNYDFGNWPVELGYEYLKDFRSYGMYIGIIYLYRFILRRAQGEAGFLSEGREEQEAEAVVDRFLVKKLGREFLVKVEDIDWIQASGNYVNLQVGKRAYPLRETMAGIEMRLLPQGFLRVHRSAIVNLDRVAEIVPFDTGDAEVRLTSGSVVPVSRRYRKLLRERLRPQTEQRA